MIKVEKIETWGFEHAIRGMRNPMNSWDKSDSIRCDEIEDCVFCPFWGTHGKEGKCPDGAVVIGENDLDLMKRLFKAGSEHRKYMRQIFISMDITAPLYWWKEFDTYKIGTTADSCSTMHKIHEKEFTLADFSCEKLTSAAEATMSTIIERLNFARKEFLKKREEPTAFGMPSSKEYWWDMIQLLPSSYNQKRTVTMSYENAVNMIRQREPHKLDEWRFFTAVLKNLPYMREITENN